MRLIQVYILIKKLMYRRPSKKKQQSTHHRKLKDLIERLHDPSFEGEYDNFHRGPEMTDQTVYVVYKNADMTEGRGPMVFDRVFARRESALAYVESKSGIMGRKTDLSESKNGVLEMNDYRVVPTTLY